MRKRVRYFCMGFGHFFCILPAFHVSFCSFFSAIAPTILPSLHRSPVQCTQQNILSCFLLKLNGRRCWCWCLVAAMAFLIEALNVCVCFGAHSSSMFGHYYLFLAFSFSVWLIHLPGAITFINIFKFCVSVLCTEALHSFLTPLSLSPSFHTRGVRI